MKKVKTNLNSAIFYGIERELAEINEYLDDLVAIMQETTLHSEVGFVGVKKYRSRYLERINDQDAYDIPDIKIFPYTKVPIDQIKLIMELAKKYREDLF